MYKKKKNDTTLRVQANAELLDFLMTKVGGTRTSLKNLLGRRVVNVNGSIQTRHDTPLHTGDTVTIVATRGNAELKHPKLRVVY